MILLKKEILLDQCPTLFTADFSPEGFARDFQVCGGSWHVENGCLIGENRENFAAMAISKEAYCENVFLDFRASVLAPCTHDINVMWNGSWNWETNTRDVAYVAGLQGWWHGKVGFEKSPAYDLNAATPLFDFVPGKEYHVQCGSIDGHVFIVVDDRLVLEITDTDPIDASTHGLVGFEAYCTRVCFRDFRVRQAVWKPVEEVYTPEF